MFSLGWQETVVIFVLALLLFGPKKLPELGKTIGKAMTEFRRASAELKSTFDREMQTIEKETQDLKQTAQQYQNEVSGYQYDDYHNSSYYNSEYNGYSTDESSPVGTQATTGADSTNGSTAPDGETVARTTDAVDPNGEAAKTEDDKRPTGAVQS